MLQVVCFFGVILGFQVPSQEVKLDSFLSTKDSALGDQATLEHAWLVSFGGQSSVTFRYRGTPVVLVVLLVSHVASGLKKYIKNLIGQGKH